MVSHRGQTRNSDLEALKVPGYQNDILGSAKIIAKDGLLGFVREAIAGSGTLYDYAAAHPDTETISGRKAVYIIPGPDSGRWVVRQLSHGGLLAPLTADRFLRFGVPRPFNELKLSVSLADLGIATPSVAAAVVYPSGPVYRGEVAREEIADSADLAECLFGAQLSQPLRSGALSAAGRLVASLHRAGVRHPDLNIKNILIRWGDEPLDAYILDIEKCKIEAGLSQRARRGMLSRFHRSIRKFEERTGERLSGEEWDSFLTSYAQAFAA